MSILLYQTVIVNTVEELEKIAETALQKKAHAVLLSIIRNPYVSIGICEKIAKESTCASVTTEALNMIDAIQNLNYIS